MPMNTKALFMIAFVAVLCSFAAVLAMNSEDTDAAVSGTPGSTVSFTWHDMDDDFETAHGTEIKSIFGWTHYLSATKSGSTARITIPSDAANGTYSFVEYCVNPENGEELDYYTQTFTVTGQKGTSSSNP